MNGMVQKEGERGKRRNKGGRKMKEEEKQEKIKKKGKENEKKIAENRENKRKFYKICAFYIAIFKKILNKNFEESILKSI